MPEYVISPEVDRLHQEAHDAWVALEQAEARYREVQARLSAAQRAHNAAKVA